ncbi:AMP-binding protein [Niveibacterium umoris]|uniref:Acyl-CoA synthetase (AMP-forming)/AMP-acid ligase II n=1 Tax=Niveibacterium umoris TaxID=1193620 RepID=A0A840BK12_9RHOO|nr:AMP-binding protein [Niveibacterium umoris]MBB4011909.1 acyl-CoA synthetase (AMP-forming)/AMP-acid ligase II [Niveibacterium umoris]
MSFWDLGADPQAPALLYGDPLKTVRYGELRQHSDDFASQLGPRRGKRLGFVLCRNDLPSVAAYLSALREGDCVALLPEGLAREALEALIARYQPDWLLGKSDTPSPASAHASRWQGRTLLRFAHATATPLHPDLALLLSTSGTTGSPRMVRLSCANLGANAESIADYLELDARERPITTLPMHYSYGLSVLNSHLQAGAAIALSDDAVTSRPFWNLFATAGATSLAGVPFIWQMLARLRLERMALPTLRTLTQAGGRLAPDLIAHFREISEARGWRFFVMYGQTEATARIAYLPPQQLAEKCGAIGRAIPGGALSLSDDGELIYQGPNVMMGYAEQRADLALGDEMHGRLATGDLARVDADSCYWLTGRIKRIAKLFGNRINLDEVESWLESRFGPAAALDEDDALRIVVTTHADVEALRIALRESLGVHPSGLRISQVEALPLTASGKKDYPALRSRLATPEASHV